MSKTTKLVDIPIVPALFAKLKRIAVLNIEILELEHQLTVLRARLKTAEEEEAWKSRRGAGP